MERKIKTHLVKDDKDTKTQRQTVRKINDKEMEKKRKIFVLCFDQAWGFQLDKKVLSSCVKKALNGGTSTC